MFFKVQNRFKRLLRLDVQHPLEASADETRKFLEQFPDLTLGVIAEVEADVFQGRKVVFVDDVEQVRDFELAAC